MAGKTSGRRPFRIRRGTWIPLCEPCRDAVHAYRKGGWCEPMTHNMKCDRCGDSAELEFYPVFAARACGERKEG